MKNNKVALIVACGVCLFLGTAALAENLTCTSADGAVFHVDDHKGYKAVTKEDRTYKMTLQEDGAWSEAIGNERAEYAPRTQTLYFTIQQRDGTVTPEITAPCK
jgi:hypothetical protein